MENYNQNIIKHKTGLLKLAEELGNIFKACRIMGFSRDTFRTKAHQKGVDCQIKSELVQIIQPIIEDHKFTEIIS